MVLCTFETSLDSLLIVNAVHYCLYVERDYKWPVFLEIHVQGSSHNTDQLTFNKEMYGAHITGERMLKEVKKYWTTIDFPMKMLVLQIQEGILWSMLISDFRICLYPKLTSIYFAWKRPTLAKFFYLRI